jgi:hypothetical protein
VLPKNSSNLCLARLHRFHRSSRRRRSSTHGPMEMDASHVRHSPSPPPTPHQKHRSAPTNGAALLQQSTNFGGGQQGSVKPLHQGTCVCCVRSALIRTYRKSVGFGDVVELMVRTSRMMNPLHLLSLPLIAMGHGSLYIPTPRNAIDSTLPAYADGKSPTQVGVS